MNIKKVDDKPMVIHTKEKTKLHVKTAPETKIKAGNVLTVERTPKFAGAEREAKADNMDKRMSALKVKFATKDSNGKADAEKRLSDKRGQSAQSSSVKSKSVKEDIKKSMQKEKSKYAQFEKSKQDREKAIGRKNGSTVSTLASVGAKTSLDQMEGGSEVYESYMVAETYPVRWKVPQMQAGDFTVHRQQRRKRSASRRCRLERKSVKRQQRTVQQKRQRKPQRQRQKQRQRKPQRPQQRRLQQRQGQPPELQPRE